MGLERHGVPVPHPCAAAFPHRWGHLRLLRTLLEASEMGLGSAKAKPKPARENQSPARGTSTTVALVCRVLVSSCFLCSWSFSSPSSAVTARLSPKCSTSNLKCFVKLCQALGGREGSPQGTKMFCFFIFKTTFSISNDFLFCGC